MSDLFIVAPCFNERAGLSRFVAALRDVLGRVPGRLAGRRHLVLVDDGSRDDTWAVIRREAGRRAPGLRVHGVKLSRNFGHQAALVAGLDAVRERLGCGDADSIVLMDADGQHPPSCLPRMLAARARGAAHVQMVRDDREVGGLKAATSRAFYRVFSALSGTALGPGSADFRCVSGYMLRQFGRFAERGRFNRGLFAWLGFRTVTLSYQPAPRRSGVTSYTPARMLKLAASGITYFSSRPLVWTSAGITGFGVLLCAAYVAFECYRRWVLHLSFVPGWWSTMFVVMFWGTLLSLNQLLLSWYLARTFDEVKRRPLYVVERTED